MVGDKWFVSEYKTVYADRPLLDKTVNQLIAEGWQPLDGAQFVYVDSYGSAAFIQTMVKLVGV